MDSLVQDAAETDLEELLSSDPQAAETDLEEMLSADPRASEESVETQATAPPATSDGSDQDNSGSSDIVPLDGADSADDTEASAANFEGDEPREDSAAEVAIEESADPDTSEETGEEGEEDETLVAEGAAPLEETTEVAGFTNIQSIPEIEIEQQQSFDFQVAADTFEHANPDEQLEFSASLENGDALPTWMRFDSETLTFSGEAPSGVTGDVAVRVIAIDSANQQAETTLTFSID
jgi:hypothetical protein